MKSIAAVLALLFVTSAAEARTACEASPPRHGYYAWREVDGRRCFTSTRGMNKATLYWPPAEAQAADAVPVPAMPAPAVSLPARSLPFAERWPK